LLGLGVMSRLMAGGIHIAALIIIFLEIRSLMKHFNELAKDKNSSGAAVEAVRAFKEGVDKIVTMLQQTIDNIKSYLGSLDAAGWAVLTAKIIGIMAGIVIAFGAIATGLYFIGQAGKGLMRAAIAAALVSVVVAALIAFSTQVSKWIEENPHMIQAIEKMGLLILAIGGLMALMGLVKDPLVFKAANKMLKAITGLIVALGLVMLAISTIPEKDFARAERSLYISLSIIGVMMILVEVISMFATQSVLIKKTFGMFAGITLLFSALMGSMALLILSIKKPEDYAKIAVATGSIILVISVLSLLFHVISTIPDSRHGIVLIWSLIGGAIVLATAVVLLSRALPETDYINKVAAVSVAMIALLAIIATMAMVINKIALSKKTIIDMMTVKKINATYVGIVSIALSMALVAGALALLKDMSVGEIAAKAALMTGFMIVLGAISVAIQRFSSKWDLKGYDALIRLAIMEAIFLSIAGLMWVVDKIPITPKTLVKCGYVVLLLIALATIGGVLSSSLHGIDYMGIKTIVTMTVIFAALMGLLKLIDILDINAKMLGKAQWIVLLMVELALIGWGIGKLNDKIEFDIDDGLKSIIALTAIFAALVILTKVLDTMKASDIIAKTQSISLIILEFTGIIALLGAMNKLSAKASVGIGCIALLTIIFGVLADIAVSLEAIKNPKNMLKKTQIIVLVILEFAAIIAALGVIALATEGLGFAAMALGAISALLLWPLVGIFKAIAKIGIAMEAIRDPDAMMKRANKISLIILELVGVLVVLGLVIPLAAVGFLSTLCLIPLIGVFKTIATIAMALEKIRSVDKMKERAHVIIDLINEFIGMLKTLARLVVIAYVAGPAIAALEALSICYYTIGLVSMAMALIKDPDGLSARCDVILGVMVKLITMTKLFRKMGKPVDIIRGTEGLYLLSSAFAMVATAAHTINGIDTKQMNEKLDSLMEVMRKLVLLATYLGNKVGSGLNSVAGSFGLAAMAGGIYLLANALAILSNIPFQSLVSSINAIELGLNTLLNAVERAVNLAAPLIAFGFGMIEMGIACVAAGVGINLAGEGIIYLAQAIHILSTTTPSELEMVKQVILTFFGALGVGIEIMITKIAEGIAVKIAILTKTILQNIALAINGIILIIHNAIPKLAVVIDEALTYIELIIKKHLGSFFADTIQAFRTNTPGVVTAAKLSATLVGNAWEHAFRYSKIEWHSDPDPIWMFLEDVGHAFDNNTQGAVDAAENSAERVGNGWADRATGIMEGLVSKMYDFGQQQSESAADGVVSGYSSYEAAWKGMAGIAQKYCRALDDYQYNLNAQLTMYNQQYLENSERARYWQTKIGNENYKNQNLANANYKLYSKRAEDAKKKELEFTQQLDELNTGLNGTTEAAEDAGDAITELGDSLDKTTKKTGGAAKATQDFAQSLEQTLVSQMNIFDKFEAKAAMSKEELLSNMQSQINGMTNWAANMDKLSTMGIDKGLYQKLAEMGPQGAQYVGAFANMTAEEMARANELWAQSLVLPGDVAGKISADWAGISGDMVNGLSKGWTDSEGIFHKNILDTSQEGQEVMKEDNGIHSPSTVYRLFGQALMLGLRFGMWDERSLLLETLTTISEMMIKRANELLNEETLVETGKNLVKGLAKGLKDESVLKELEDASEEVSEIPDRVTRKHNLIESPSKLFMQHGKYIDKGLAMGLLQNQGLVSTAMDEVNNTVLDSMKYTIATIATTLQDGIEDPVITPVLDLSRVSSGIRTLNSAFSTNQALAAAGSMSSLQNGQPVAGVQFIQNNYSPKALSRADIYRQTRNQFAQYRSAML